MSLIVDLLHMARVMISHQQMGRLHQHIGSRGPAQRWVVVKWCITLQHTPAELLENQYLPFFAVYQRYSVCPAPCVKRELTNL